MLKQQLLLHITTVILFANSADLQNWFIKLQSCSVLQHRTTGIDTRRTRLLETILESTLDQES